MVVTLLSILLGSSVPRAKTVRVGTVNDCRHNINVLQGDQNVSVHLTITVQKHAKMYIMVSSIYNDTIAISVCN